MLRALCLALLLPGSAGAQGYADNPAVAAFRDRPCAEVVDVIYVREAAGLTLQETMGLVSQKNLYMGFILGFDTARGGLQGEAESTLARLREACAADPEATALELLEGLAEGTDTSSD